MRNKKKIKICQKLKKKFSKIKKKSKKNKYLENFNFTNC